MKDIWDGQFHNADSPAPHISTAVLFCMRHLSSPKAKPRARLLMQSFLYSCIVSFIAPGFDFFVLNIWQAQGGQLDSLSRSCRNRSSGRAIGPIDPGCCLFVCYPRRSPGRSSLGAGSDRGGGAGISSMIQDGVQRGPN